MTANAFEQLLTGHGLDLAPERMRWMILTWDLAIVEGEINKYVRFALCSDRMVMGTGRRRESCFGTSAVPHFGEQFGDSDTDDQDPLVLAHECTDAALANGYHLVCRPLAVDCSALAYTVRASSPRLLFNGLSRSYVGATRMLRELNRVRAEALATHLDPKASEHFPDLSPEDLWAGRR